ncbi:MAG: site-2 protease family protein [Paracoccaceae bacterium]
MFSDDQSIFEFRGPWRVPVQIGPSILLMVLLFVSFTGSPREIAYDLAFLAMVVGSILLHELGHAWGCLIQDVPVRRVMLHGFGGYCQHARATTPRESELIVAMGPIVTVVLWAVSGLIVWAMQTADRPYDTVMWFFMTLSWLNGYLAVFNLLPIAPLDGGKIFELIVLRFTDGQRASRIAGVVGMAGLVVVVPYLLVEARVWAFALFFLPAVMVNWNKLRGLSC